MPTPDLSTHGSTLPVLRSKLIIDISTEDYINERGFIAVVQADGDLHYVTLEDDELTETLSAGDTVNVAQVPVALKRVRSVANGNSTVNSIQVGIF